VGKVGVGEGFRHFTSVSAALIATLTVHKRGNG